MARSASEVLGDQWRKRIKRQRASGLTIAEFCRREALNRQSFHLWKRKLGLGRAVASSERPQRRAKFLQVPLTPTLTVQGSSWFELVLADGTILRLPQQNIGALLAVLRELRGEQTAASEVIMAAGRRR